MITDPEDIKKDYDTTPDEGINENTPYTGSTSEPEAPHAYTPDEEEDAEFVEEEASALPLPSAPKPPGSGSEACSATGFSTTPRT